MFKLVKDTKLKRINAIVEQNPGMGFIVTEFEQIRDKRGVLDYFGKLFAIADKADVDKLYETSRSLDEQGVDNVITTLTLYEDECHIPSCSFAE